MKIGLIDVDGHNYPNLPLMKISAYHKQKGDEVSWYEPFDGMIKHYDKVYMSKVFSFSPDYERPIYADEIVKGGSGYCITIGEDGREKFDQEKNVSLPDEIEHIMPDYSLVVQDKFKDTAFGFMTRGCPRGCEFCIVGKKEGRRPAYKVADLDEFWSGQKNIELLDPNFFSSENWGVFRAAYQVKGDNQFQLGYRYQMHYKRESGSDITNEDINRSLCVGQIQG